MEFDYIRSQYRVPAEAGRRVVCSGQPGVIVKAINQYIGVRLDGASDVRPYHPTHEVEYGDLVEASDSPPMPSWKCLAPWRDEYNPSDWFTIEAETRGKARYAAFKYLRDDCECDIDERAFMGIKVRAVH